VRARRGTCRALAHALGGDIDRACVAAREVLDDAARVDSATIRLDLRELARTLSRWRTHDDVRELYPDLLTNLRAR
ncbi:MAG: transcriptional regulator, partial [Actinophytocola sp.]